MYKRRRLFWFILTALCLILNLAARFIAGFAEWYAGTIYPIFVGTLGRLFSLIPVSLSELLVFALPFLFLAGIVLLLKKRLKPRRALEIVGCFVVAAFLLFTLNAGINYHRLTFSERAGFIVAESTEEELITLCEYLAEELNEAAAGITLDEAGNYLLTEDVAKEAIKAMQAAAVEYPELSGYYPRAKAVFNTWFLSYQQLQGVYSPFTVEANYNGAMPDQDKPSSVCHELSHLKGFMREDEANFIAYLACHASESAAFRYSGALMAFIYSGNALYAQDAEAYYAVRERLCEQALRDLQSHNNYWRSYEGTVSEVADRVNDTYLKANSQEAGTQSYGHMVDLMLAWKRSGHV